MNDKSEKTVKITHRLELLIWLLVILLFVSTSSLSFINKEKNDENDYQIFLPDVDGLIVGSPVRMMGIEVGNVTKIKPTKDEVYVKFIITNPDVYIPAGSYITVEFSGMAGSKSLELYPPEKQTGFESNVITVNSPKRLHDALSLLNDMFKKIGSIIYTTSSFGNKLNEHDLALPKGQSSDMKEFIKYSNVFLDESNRKVNEMRSGIEGFKNDKQIQQP